MTDGQEFNQTARVTYQFAGLEYWIDVNEYGAVEVRCFKGRGEEWRIRVRPGKTLQESWSKVGELVPDDSWMNRFELAIVDLRGLVGA